MNGNDSSNEHTMSGHDTSIDRETVIALFEGYVADLKAQLENANAEKKELLELANRLQKQNEILTLPSPDEKHPTWIQRMLGISIS